MPSSVVLVTGAAGQIGRRLVARVTEAGYAVVGLDLAAGDGILGCDITDPEAVRATVDDVLAEHGRIDVLVHNAGISAIGRFEDHGVETHARVLAVNYLGPVALTQAALPALREARGRVVVIGSVAGFAPVLGRPAYVGANLIPPRASAPRPRRRSLRCRNPRARPVGSHWRLPVPASRPRTVGGSCHTRVHRHVPRLYVRLMTRRLGA